MSSDNMRVCMVGSLFLALLIMVPVALGESFLGSLFSRSLGKTYPPPAVMGDESIMSQKSHGTSDTPVQSNLRWNVDWDTADRICNYNRHYAEYSGYWQTTGFPGGEEASAANNDNSYTITFYDSNTGKPLFIAPRNRTFAEFVQESQKHGWPSFRDDETVWDNVRVLPNGETVSVDGTHLGHNLPDSTGSRYCINLVSVAGRPVEEEEDDESRQ